MDFKVRDLQFVSDVKTLAQERGWDYCTHHPDHKQIRLSSQTVQSQVEEIVRGGSQQAADFKIVKDDLLESERYIARLYATREYTIKETFTCEIPDATIIGRDGIVVTNQGEVLLQSTTFGSRRELHARLALLKHLDIPTHRVEGTLVSLIGAFDDYYGHWLIDFLPRLTMIDIGDPSLKFLIPSEAHAKRFHYEALLLLGIAKHQCVQPRSISEQFSADRLILCHASAISTIPSKHHVIPLANLLKERVSASEGVRRVYLSRANVWRSVVNEAALMPVLNHYGFEILRPDELSLAEQIRLFSECKVLMGPNGSGLANQVWCSPGAIIIDILNKQRWMQDVVHLSGTMGHAHWHIWAENVNDRHDMKVNVVHLDEVLSTALREPAFHSVVRQYLDAYPDAYREE